MKIGFRTIKTAFGVSVSILIAQSLGLSYFPSAGILTLLCIQKTRKESIAAILDRLYACLIGLALSSVLFSFIGYHAMVFLLMYLIFIPICVKYKIQGGIASSSVIMTHTYMHEAVNIQFFINESAIIFIGLGIALLVNLYMPGIDKQINRYKQEIDSNMAVVLNELAKYLKEGYGLWDGKEMLTLSDLLKKARNLAILEVENNLTRKDNPFFYYFELKQQQFQVLERMLPIVSRIDAKLEQGVRIGEFMEDISGNIHRLSDTGTGAYIEKLKRIREYHKQLPMPENRAEFENRANLFNLANELESFIQKY
ncbi:aromatic acid exporter family protein [Paenibacillus alkalitolerans]|uniref:aromatic acid exporter family protein n=1 Tax=Paenibacillus alkalitolerans TaxID=2799335 RepID=UPI0018F6DE43|nr:aromatic acid exporter family protein [Paenibacillus alkalitolerans]